MTIAENWSNKIEAAIQACGPKKAVDALEEEMFEDSIFHMDSNGEEYLGFSDGSLYCYGATFTPAEILASPDKFANLVEFANLHSVKQAVRHGHD